MHRRPVPWTFDRRHFLALAPPRSAAAVAAALPAPAAPPISALGVDAAQFGLRPGSPDDQSRALQRAIDEAARTRAPLALAPGSLSRRRPAAAVGRAAHRRARRDQARAHRRAVAVRGRRRRARHADRPRPRRLRRQLPDRRGLVHLDNVRRLRIADCEIIGAGGNAIALHRQSRARSPTRTITDSADVAIHSLRCARAR